MIAVRNIATPIIEPISIDAPVTGFAFMQKKGLLVKRPVLRHQSFGSNSMSAAMCVAVRISPPADETVPTQRAMLLAPKAGAHSEL